MWAVLLVFAIFAAIGLGVWMLVQMLLLHRPR